MLLEVAILNVLPNQSADFEKAFAEAQAIISASLGYQRHELRRCVETPDRYLLLVWWKEVEHYTPLYEGSAGRAS